MSARGRANTNGPNAIARMFGVQRAAQRHAIDHKNETTPSISIGTAPRSTATPTRTQTRTGQVNGTR
jgi:hypothetical protein